MVTCPYCSGTGMEVMYSPPPSSECVGVTECGACRGSKVVDRSRLWWRDDPWTCRACDGTHLIDIGVAEIVCPACEGDDAA